MTMTPPDIAPLPKGFLIFAAFVLLADRLAFHIFANPLPDETYYWLWGQHPDWSYYDHPPLQAWLQGLTAALFGDSIFALRLPAALSSAILLATSLWWLRRYARKAKTTAILVIFASPLFFIFTAMVFNDHLLIALLSLAGVFSYKTLDTVARTGRVAKGPLYTAALLIGLAGLTKYNAALFALGVGASVLVVPRFRPLLRSVHTYLAAGLMLACLTPVFVWNRAHGAASFRYNLSDRLETAPDLAQIAGQMAGFLLAFSVVASPFLIVALWRMRKAPAPENWRALAGITFGTATLSCLVVAIFTHVLYYWNIIALIVFLPFAAAYMKRWQLVAHLGFGLLVATLFTLNYTVLPVSALFGKADLETASTFGWKDIAARVETLQQETGAPALVASDYRNGAMLGFHTPAHKVRVLSARHSQFDFWPAPAEDAVILTDEWHPLSPEIRAAFASITPLDSLTVSRFGKPLMTYRFYLGKGQP